MERLMRKIIPLQFACRERDIPQEEFPEMVKRVDRDTRTERMEVFDTSPGRGIRLFSSLSSWSCDFQISPQNAIF
jgi:hypothetical protein